MFDQSRDFYAGDLYGGMGATTEAYAQATNAVGNGGMSRSGVPDETAPGGNDQISHAAQIGAKLNPIAAFFILIGLVIAVMLSSEWLGGEEGKYTNMRASAYNILFISLIAFTGTFFWRNFLTKFPVPGLTTVAHAA